jgi:hypothetical protein
VEPSVRPGGYNVEAFFSASVEILCFHPGAVRVESCLKDPSTGDVTAASKAEERYYLAQMEHSNPPSSIGV